MGRSMQFWAAFIAASLVISLGSIAWPFTVDDAFIVARFSENLASGHGYGMNPGAPGGGVTGPLWLVPLVASARLGLDPMIVAKGLGLLATGAAVFAAVLGARIERTLALVAVVVSASLAPSLYIWAGAGLETGLSTLVVTLAGLEVIARRRPRLAVLIPCLAVLPWLRPECLPVALIFVVMAAARDRVGGRWAASALVASGLCVALFRLALFDSMLPLAVYAKPVGLIEGLPYVLAGALRVTGGAGLVSIGLAVALGGGRERALGFALAVHLMAVAIAGGDWMPGHRLLVPILPLAGLLAGEGVGLVAAGGRVRFASALALVTTLVLAGDGLLELPAALASGETRESAGADLADAIGERHRRVALVDVGYIGRRGGVEVIDLGGVTDPMIGRGEGDYLDKHIDPAYLASRDPDAILLHSSAPPGVDAEGRLTRLAGYGVERRVASMPWVRAHFRVHRVIEYSPDYYYVWLQRAPAY